MSAQQQIIDDIITELRDEVSQVHRHEGNRVWELEQLVIHLLDRIEALEALHG